MAKQKENTDKRGDFLHYMRIIIALLMVVFAGISCYAGFKFGRMVFTDQPKTTLRTEHVSYELTVEKGESVLSIGKDLEEHGIIDSAAAFFVQTKVYKCKIAPGTYTVSSRDSSKAIVKALNSAFIKGRQEEE